jgi:hypothetical protein
MQTLFAYMDRYAERGAYWLARLNIYFGLLDMFVMSLCFLATFQPWYLPHVCFGALFVCFGLLVELYRKKWLLRDVSKDVR